MFQIKVVILSVLIKTTVIIRVAYKSVYAFAFSNQF